MVTSTSRFMHPVITCVKSTISVNVESNSFVWCIASLCGEYSNIFQSSWRRTTFCVLSMMESNLNPIDSNDITSNKFKCLRLLYYDLDSELTEKCVVAWYITM
eukprot:525379_1